MNQGLRASIIDYCAHLGKDPLLVQGAGGNASWKTDDTLWVKASGTWLADAADKEIFVPVNLLQLKSAIDQGDFSVTPQTLGDSALRPSIETLLHALMPHQVVVHLHAIEILAHLVRDNCRTALETRLDPAIPWVMVDYFKPGAALAAAINAELIQKSATTVVFLKNHGVVVGGQNTAEVGALIDTLIATLRTPIPTAEKLTEPEWLNHGQFAPIQDREVQQLAVHPELFRRLHSDWVLYPDHVVFLGARACSFPSWDAFDARFQDAQQQPELVFIEGKGVYAQASFHKAKQAQLRCYYDILVRQQPSTALNTLSDEQIAELLNWDAEKYRMQFNKA